MYPRARKEKVFFSSNVFVRLKTSDEYQQRNCLISIWFLVRLIAVNNESRWTLHIDWLIWIVLSNKRNWWLLKNIENYLNIFVGNIFVKHKWKFLSVRWTPCGPTNFHRQTSEMPDTRRLLTSPIEAEIISFPPDERRIESSISNYGSIQSPDESPSAVDEMDDSKTTLKFFEKIGFSLGHIYNDLCAGVWFSYTLLFMQGVQKMPGAQAGAMVMLGQIGDAIATPIVGILTDKYSTKRKWHIFGKLFIIRSLFKL